MLQLFLQSLDYYEKVYEQNPFNVYLYYFNYIISVIGVFLLFLFGFRKWKEGRSSENAIAGSIAKTLGIFFFFASVTLLIFYIDRIYIFFNEGERILGSQNPEITWIEYDYMWLSIAMVTVSTAILHYPLEKYLLQKDKYPLTKFIIFTCIFLPFARWAENQWGMPASYVFLGLPTLGGVLGLFSFFIQYLKLGVTAPAGSELKRKSMQILLGFFLFIIGVGSSTNLSKGVYKIGSQVDLHILAPLGPIVFLIGILLLYQGYRRE
jgi:hypothetical protein